MNRLKLLRLLGAKQNRGPAQAGPVLGGGATERVTMILKNRRRERYEVRNDDGGDEGIRTLDLSDANRTLSQLSYAPNFFQFFHFPGCGSGGWQARYAN